MSIGFVEPPLTGWDHEREDRDWLHAQPGLPPMDKETPTEDVDPRQDSMPVLNQGQEGSCAGHANCECGALLNWILTGVWLIFCRQAAYVQAQLIDGSAGSDCGSTISGNMKARARWGWCLDSVWPYTGKYNTNIPKACYEEGSHHKLLKFIDCRGYEKTRDFVGYKLGGVAIGIGWRGCKIIDGWKIEDYTPGQGGGHSIAIVGVLWSSMKDENGDPYLLLLNSWGTAAGKGGFYVVAPKAYRKMMADGFCEALGASNMEAFERAGISITESFA